MTTTSETRMDWVRDIKLRMQAVKLSQEEADEIIAFIQHRVRGASPKSGGTSYIEVQVLNPDGLRDEVEQIFVDGVTRALSRISKP